MPTQQTKTKSTVDFDTLWTDFVNKFQSQNNVNLTPAQKQKYKSALKAKVADSSKTRQGVSQAEIPADVADQATQHLASLLSNDLKDKISDQQAAKNAGVDQTTSSQEQPTTPETLPSVINKDLSTEVGKEVEWHMVKHLPGYLKEPIRALGRDVFGAVTQTPVEQIQVMSNLAGNDDAELQAVANYAQKHGERMSSAEYDFNNVIPEYSADVEIYNVDDYVLMFVEDFMGRYIYAWPADNSPEGKVTFKEWIGEWAERTFDPSQALRRMLQMINNKQG